MDTSVPPPSVNGEILKMFVGRRVRTVVQVQQNEGGVVIGQSTDGHQLTIRGAPGAPEPPHYMEVIGIVDSNQSIRAESCADFGENFVDLDEDAAKKVQDITVFFSKYYKMFNHETDLVYTLYAEGCILNWPNSEGAVITINTIEAAKNLFLMKSRLWKDVLMRTICVQAIHNGGFLAVVIGRFTTLDKQICKFSQTFILSEKDNEYKIVNDVLIIQGTMQAKNVGIGRGAGYNVNLCLPDAFEDDDLLAGIQYVLLPVAKAFLPDIVLVSAGFDAAMGDPLGGCKVTPPGFATVIDELKRIPAKRGLVLALEGGYNLESLANSAAACLKALLGDREDVLTLEGLCPHKETWDEIVASRQQLTPVWPVLESAIPQAVLDNYKLAVSQLPAAGQEPQEPAFPRRNPRRTVTERNQRRASAGKDPGKH